MSADTSIRPEADESVSLYSARVKCYPKSVNGKFRTIKWVLMSLGLAIYFLVPLLRWDRGELVPNQAILFDLAGRRLYLFNMVFWPQEIYLLTGLMMSAAFLLFLATALFGRIWCGFACPQTVWTDLFVLVEHWVTGDRVERMRFDRLPLTASKFLKKTLIHVIWLAISIATGIGLVSWYVDASNFILNLIHFDLSSGIWFTILTTAVVIYFMAAIGREQVCIYMCPWPRIQSSMLDEHSRLVTYQAWRGEPKGKVKDKNAGDCIDCRACLHACPTGTDIREGDQVSCIDCALCIDACDQIMTRLKRKKGLIAWESAIGQEQIKRGEVSQKKFIRPRTIIYSIIIMSIFLMMALAVHFRNPANITVLHDRQPLFTKVSDGSLRNGYTIKISSRASSEENFVLHVEGVPSALIAIAGDNSQPLGKSLQLHGKADGQTSYHIMVTAPPAATSGNSRPLKFVLDTRENGFVVAHDHFFG